jgi:crotonobetainyl-CoA:carnitine CoA-transferase CaiB-like acyl-CoA transferase
MQFTHDTSSPQALPVPGIGDHATSISLYASIVSGLYRRERTGKGCNVCTSLMANGVWATSTMRPTTWQRYSTASAGPTLLRYQRLNETID